MMNPNVKRLYQAVLLIGSSVFFIIMAVATPVILDATDFSIYNTGWNGCSDIAIRTYQTGKFLPTLTFDESDLTPSQQSFVQYSVDASNTTILIIGPQTSFSEDEAKYIKHFLNQGGLLFLADDFGTGNNLLSQINATSQFSQHLMLDLSFEKNASFVAIFDICNRSHPLTENISGLLLNYPSSLQTTENATVLARSSQISWLDTNMNGKEDVDESHGPFTVLAIEPYGQGEIVLFSGPSLLINSMSTQIDNKPFKDQLFHYLYEGRDTVIIDESHRDVSMPFHIAYVFPSSIGPGLKISILLLLVIAFLFLFTEIPRNINNKILQMLTKSKESPHRETIASIIDNVMEKHPTWIRSKLENIVKRLEKYD